MVEFMVVTNLVLPIARVFNGRRPDKNMEHMQILKPLNLDKLYSDKMSLGQKGQPNIGNHLYEASNQTCHLKTSQAVSDSFEKENHLYEASNQTCHLKTSQAVSDSFEKEPPNLDTKMPTQYILPIHCSEAAN
ncbi:hypothetical protein QE152_g24396 [Popillia japonica]|uniref:Prolactin receptor n=1 Tax=Popillia japonica TaxID=7064 RepID=A0AAW1KG73_POPJA